MKAKKTFDVFADLYSRENPIASLGNLYRHPKAGFTNGRAALVATVKAPKDSDGQTCKIYESRLPARFFTLKVLPGPNSIGEMKAGYEIRTGSGSGMGELVGILAKSIEMKYLSIALLTMLGLLTSCGREQPPHDFNYYLDKFVGDAKTYGRYIDDYDVIIKFDPLQDGGDGLYYDYYIPPAEVGEIPTLLVKPSWWDRTSDVEHEIALYHMFGHRVLNRDHRDDLQPGERTLMEYPFPPVADYVAHRDEYLRELFLDQETPIRELPK